ncbi:sterile alpha motif domain-containing 3-like isoform X2 [Labeo rohita]|uniref:Sterile alpha motif domain-containing 3-like isoform X2 n=1 Tax=Labeo rohita TaxID=84645 RepID=A0A498N7V2_LABRO|nr:sterile alpha motif domain-containing 3-like isoform X2 [Labeo rohita]
MCVGPAGIARYALCFVVINYKAPSVLGEDPSSIEAHVNVLNSQYQKIQPDFRIVRDRMQQTFAWRQKEIVDGMTVEDTVKKYPFLRTPTGLCDELERIHPATGNLCQRFNEGFKCIVPKVLQLAQRKCYSSFTWRQKKKLLLRIFQDEADQREEAEREFEKTTMAFFVICESDALSRALDICIVTDGVETDLDSPYPTIQLTDRDWKMAFARRAPNILKVDHIELFRNSGIDEGIISAFCTYFVFNLAYPRHLKNTLMFLQRPLPFVMAHRVPPDCKYWHVFLLCREITEIVMAPKAAADAFTSIEETTVGIYILKSQDRSEDFGIVLEGQKVLQGLDNFALAMAMLFGLMYALNLNYPPEMKHTFEVLQKIVMELEGCTLSKKAQVLRNRLYK